jgi:TATA-box binding protein (TBP) (component of TFIID and TFIIIB)
MGHLKYTIVNMVASASLNATLDLYGLAVSVPDIEYEPEQFPGAILKLKEPKVSLLLFKNGKLIISGASSEEQIVQAIKKASKIIHEIQPTVRVPRNVEYEVVNLVATANLNRSLDLFKTALGLDNVEYEPEQFPGAICIFAGVSARVERIPESGRILDEKIMGIPHCAFLSGNRLIRTPRASGPGRSASPAAMRRSAH